MSEPVYIENVEWYNHSNGSNHVSKLALTYGATRVRIVGTNKDILMFLKQNNITAFAACLHNSMSYEKIDFSIPAAVVVGSESTGLSTFWTKESKSNIKIPMLGTLDSMNVSVAAAVLLFEATRQRNFYRDIKVI